MAEAIISEVFSVIIKNLGSKAYKEAMFAKDLDSHVKRLQQLKTTVEATILDAPSGDSCTNAQKDVLEKLDCALTDLDDFLDTKANMAKKKEMMQGNKLIKEVRLFFSKSNQLASTFRDAHKLKGIIKKFESISEDYAKFGAIISVPSVKQTQTSSAGSVWSNCQILTEEVIGRDEDRNMVVKMLLENSISSQTLSVVSIVGIGGIGKTTLAKYAYHDERVKSWFDVRFWVSTTQNFDLRQIILEIFATFGNLGSVDNYDIAQMYDCFKTAIGGKKFLLVLDNVWDQEDLRYKWLDLKKVLSFGASGSRVLVTTRNKVVATLMECVKPYMLGDLDEEDSWLLFKKIAFTHCQESGVEKIGRQIVYMCPNVPLVIRSIGGLLARKCTVMEWSAFRNDQLAKFSSYGRDIIQTLKLSYDQLDQKLKLCVTYFSLFPKECNLNFEESFMIDLWISLGYIEASYANQTLEDAAKECILMLVSQGFLIIEKDLTFMMHKVMHELVCCFAGFKYHKMRKVGKCEIDKRIRHLGLIFDPERMEPYNKMFSSFPPLESLAALAYCYWISFDLPDRIFKRFSKLRVLLLCNMGLTRVPSSVGELISLRYLDLSGTLITRLPNSITQLVELFSINVSHCRKLEEFPRGIRKLLKLRHIRNVDCSALMPKEITSMTDLQTLDMFHLGEGDCGLVEFNAVLNYLTEKICVEVRGHSIARRCSKANEEHWKWKSKGNLEVLHMIFTHGCRESDFKVIEGMQLNTNLRKLVIYDYKGERLPRWMKDEIHYFNNLVEIEFWNFGCCESLGSFGRLPHLKVLFCKYLKRVEYVEESWEESCSSNAPLFPSLETLNFVCMNRLEKWYKVVSNGETSSTTVLAPKLAFPKLKMLWVTRMELVESIAREFRGFSSLQTLKIDNCEGFGHIPDAFLNLFTLDRICIKNYSKDLMALRRPQYPELEV